MTAVSVTTALYNHKPFLAERVRSILHQTLRDFEWIVVDDCSTDGSYDEICRLTAGDPRARVLRNDVNRGHMYTNQRALDCARAPYVYRVDSDDSCDLRFLATMTAVLDAHPEAGFGYCRSLRMDTKNGVWGGIPRWPGRYTKAPGAFSDLALDYNIRSPSLLFRRDALRKAGRFDYLPPGMNAEWNADWHLALRMALISDLIFHPEPLAYHRTHASNLSTDLRLTRNNLALLADAFDHLPPAAQHLDSFRADAYRNAAAGLHALAERLRSKDRATDAAALDAEIARYVPGFTPLPPKPLKRLVRDAALVTIKLLTYRRHRTA